MGVKFQGGAGIFSFATMSRLAVGPTQAPTKWVPGCEAHHSPLSSTEIKITLSYTSTSPYVFMT